MEQSLTQREAIELLHPVIGAVAARAHVRVLFIKGPTLARQSLRDDDHVSNDVDLLVEPGKFSQLCAVLTELGWSEVVADTGAHVVPLHSATLRHAEWGCEVDVHRLFPGLLAPPDRAFETLWQRRETVDLAHQSVACPDRTAHALIASLHWLRDGEAYAGPRLDTLAASVGPGARDEMSALARALGAGETAAPLLSRLGLEAVGLSPASRDWRIRQERGDVRAVPWLLELGRQSPRRWPRLLVHGALLTEPEIRRLYPEAAPGRGGLLLARVRRIVAGVRDLPRAIRILVRAGKP